MADPLRTDDFIETDQHTADINTVAYQSPLADAIRKGETNPDRQLPESGNPKLNRAAEQLGGTLGKAVHGVRRAPMLAKRRLHVVGDRAQEGRANMAEHASSSASALAGNVQQKARDLSDRAKSRASELMDTAEAKGRVLLDKADEIRGQVAQRAGELKQRLDDRTRELQQAARLRIQQARLESERLGRERPLHVLGAIAVAGFILGVSLRIVRSRNASRY